MSRTLKIANHSIGQEHAPFIIAEMSGNHNRSLDRALKIVEAAAECGCHALKLQTYTADTLTIDADNEDFFINDTNSLWYGQSLYKLYQQAYTPWEWHEPIFKRCHELGLIAFSTPFDESAVDFLEKLNVPAYKIASFENNHLPLIRRVALTGKPLIISTGMASITEIGEAVETAREAGCKEIILLKCTSTYPATPNGANLKTIPHLRDIFGTEVGLSDHTLGIGVSIAGIAFGATVVEKHFTLRRADGGFDSAFSIEPREMRMLVDESFKAWQSCGKINYGMTSKERASIMFRRSIYVVEDIEESAEFTSDNIRVIRPGYGLPPKFYDIILGKKSAFNIKKGSPVKWQYIS